MDAQTFCFNQESFVGTMLRTLTIYLYSPASLYLFTVTNYPPILFTLTPSTNFVKCYLPLPTTCFRNGRGGMLPDPTFFFAPASASVLVPTLCTIPSFVSGFLPWSWGLFDVGDIRIWFCFCMCF